MWEGQVLPQIQAFPIHSAGSLPSDPVEKHLERLVPIDRWKWNLNQPFTHEFNQQLLCTFSKAVPLTLSFSYLQSTTV